MGKIIVFFISLDESKDFIEVLKQDQLTFHVSPRLSDRFERINIVLDDMDKMVHLFHSWFSGGLGHVKFGSIDNQNRIQYNTTVCGGSYNSTEHMLLNCSYLQILNRLPASFIKNPAPDVHFKGKYFLILGHFLSGNQAQYAARITQCGGIVKKVNYFMGGADYIVMGDKTLQNWQRKNFSHNLFNATDQQKEGKLAIISESHCAAFMKGDV